MSPGLTWGLPLGKFISMNTLRRYLNSLAIADQSDLAVRCGTSLGYLRKAISINQQLGAELCIRIEYATQGAVRCEDLRPDINWGVLRSTQPHNQAA